MVSGGGCGRGLSVMSLKSSSNGGFESKYQRKEEAVEKDKEIVGERNKGRLRNNKR